MTGCQWLFVAISDFCMERSREAFVALLLIASCVAGRGCKDVLLVFTYSRVRNAVAAFLRQVYEREDCGIPQMEITVASPSQASRSTKDGTITFLAHARIVPGTENHVLYADIGGQALDKKRRYVAFSRVKKCLYILMEKCQPTPGPRPEIIRKGGWHGGHTWDLSENGCLERLWEHLTDDAELHSVRSLINIHSLKKAFNHVNWVSVAESSPTPNTATYEHFCTDADILWDRYKSMSWELLRGGALEMLTNTGVTSQCKILRRKAISRRHCVRRCAAIRRVSGWRPPRRGLEDGGAHV